MTRPRYRPLLKPVERRKPDRCDFAGCPHVADQTFLMDSSEFTPDGDVRVCDWHLETWYLALDRHRDWNRPDNTGGEDGHVRAAQA